MSGREWALQLLVGGREKKGSDLLLSYIKFFPGRFPDSSHFYDFNILDFSLLKRPRTQVAAIDAVASMSSGIEIVWLNPPK